MSQLFKTKDYEHPLVSVIIPFYKGKQWLKEAINSVLNQSYQNFELIIINDGSPEIIDEDAFLPKDNRIIYIKQDNFGAAAARNKGLSISNGIYIAFLDADDLWEVDKLSIQIDAMNYYNSSFSYTAYKIFGEDVSENNVYIASESSEIQSCEKVSRHIATPTIIIRKELLIEKQLFFDSKLKYGEDGDMWRRVLLYTDALAINQVLTKVRIRGTNATKKARAHIMNASNRWIFILKNNIQHKYPIYVVWSLNYSIMVENFLKKIEQKMDNEKSVEFISKLLFIPIYIFYYKLYLHRIEK